MLLDEIYSLRLAILQFDVIWVYIVALNDEAYEHDINWLQAWKWSAISKFY